MCLKLATVYVDSGVSWEDLLRRPMPDASCDWPWATCLEIQSDSQLMVASAEPGFA